jgi:uncharacterized protein YfaS (alpha-2-macroglobulin family)
LELLPERQDDIERNVKAAIRKLPRFQTPEGGFGFWRGSSTHDWCSSYVGHFLIEATKVGYIVPSGVIEQWLKYQRKAALSWVRSRYRSDLAQAYRLFTLALAGEPELGAMNRLKEELNLASESRWRLAAAYQLGGQPEVARDIVRDLPLLVKDYRELTGTFGSRLRDRAMILETLCLLGDMDRAAEVVADISEEMCSDNYWSTQATAYALIAMARHAGITGSDDEWSFSYRWNDGVDSTVRARAPLVQIPLTVDDLNQTAMVTNGMQIPLYARLVLEGIPPAGRERASSNGLKVAVLYTTPDGDTVDVSRLDQGVDIAATVTVTNIGRTGDYDELALTQIVPSG